MITHSAYVLLVCLVSNPLVTGVTLFAPRKQAVHRQPSSKEKDAVLTERSFFDFLALLVGSAGPFENKWMSSRNDGGSSGLSVSVGPRYQLPIRTPVRELLFWWDLAFSVGGSGCESLESISRM